VEQTYVTNGLRVNVYPEGSSSSARRMKPNVSGVFTTHDLPRLRLAEAGAGDDAYWARVSTRSFVVEVSDATGQFMPFSFSAQLPFRGLFVWTCALSSPPATNGLSDGVVLFSAPSRAIAPMRAVIRAQLQDAASGGPAAGAVLSAVIGSWPAVFGVADAQGRVVVLTPYPEPSDFPDVGDWTSPPFAPTGATLASYTWPVALSVQYAGTTAYPAFPDLCTTLSQAPGTLWGTTAGGPFAQQTLTMGVPLVLRTVDATTGLQLPVVLVAAG
jgi:hypothetical protein